MQQSGPSIRTAARQNSDAQRVDAVCSFFICFGVVHLRVRRTIDNNVCIGNCIGHRVLVTNVQFVSREGPNITIIKNAQEIGRAHV